MLIADVKFMDEVCICDPTRKRPALLYTTTSSDMIKIKNSADYRKKQVQSYGHRQKYRRSFSLRTITTAAGTHWPSQLQTVCVLSILWSSTSFDRTVSAAHTHTHTHTRTDTQST